VSDLMTMRDIAGLAHVQRPVVTVWRRRSRASAHPFPAAHQRRGNQELFLREEVVAWLEDTQRGNNPDVRADAAAHSLLDSADNRDARALSALLTLRHLISEPIGQATADALLDAADQHDPDDRCLFTELERADDLEGLARTAEALVEAAWNTDSAHRRLVDARLRTPGSALAQVAVTEPARRALLALFGPLTRELGQPSVMDPTGCAVDVLPDIAAALELPALIMDGERSAHRLLRRQLLLADVPYREVRRGSGDWSVTGPVAHLVVLPAPTAPNTAAAEHLDLLDEIALQLDEEQLVLCVAPAATLADPLDGAALTRRDQLLRDGLVRAIVRLPAGLRPAQAREHSALWLLGPADLTPPAERRTMVADLDGLTLRESEGLADDLLAAWQGADGARRRAWTHLHPVLTRDLISASATLVPTRPARAGATGRTGADWVVNLRAADTAGRLDGYGLAVGHDAAEEVTLARANERGWVRIVPGRKVDLHGLPAGSIRVIDAPAGQPLLTVDRLALMARAEVDLTEPGDVVFTVRPTPRAVVDAEGGALVRFPARILRLRADAPLVPASVVARINAAANPVWQNWTLAVVPDPDRAALGEALAGLAAERARLVAELTALDALRTDLTTAVESRQLSITKENHGPTSH